MRPFIQSTRVCAPAQMLFLPNDPLVRRFKAGFLFMLLPMFLDPPPPLVFLGLASEELRHLYTGGGGGVTRNMGLSDQR
jgi:hypothetical protein